ncbi:cilia- and flagella-associated protein 53, partial [Silurus asotus]
QARKPSSRTMDYFNMERRKQDTARNTLLDFTKDQRACNIRMRWEKNTEQKMVSATIKQRVHKAMEQYEMSIDERRERLHKLLESEERELLREMQTKKNTILENQARMRERAKYLQGKRESERQKVVAEKFDQLVREQSQEVRAFNTRRQLEEVYTERAAQIQTRQEERQMQLEEEMKYAQLWEEDRLAKERYEDLHAQSQREKNLEQLAFLHSQMEAAEQHRLQEKQLKNEEAQLLRNQREIMHLEEQRENRLKLQNQKKRRRQLDTSLRLKMKRLAREQQEDLELDMSILEQLLAQTDNEKKEEALRKLELREEQLRYRQYLAQQLKEQKQQEAEMEQMIEADLQQTCNRRAEENRLVKEARDRLMKDVLDTRHLQIQEKLQRNAQKQAELAQERDELNRTIQENKLLDEQEKKRFREACHEYQADLLAQLLHKQQLCDAEQAEIDREAEMNRLNQEKYDQKVQEILSRPTSHTTAVHPFRKR